MSKLDQILKMRPRKGRRIESPTNEDYERLATEADKLLRKNAIQSGSLLKEKATIKLRSN